MPVNGIKLKEGQIWEDNVGIRRTIKRNLSGSIDFPWIGENTEGGGHSTLTNDGRFNGVDYSYYDLNKLIYNPESEEKTAMTNKFNPQPGDKIICNNGKEFICCTLGNLKSKGIASHLDDEVSIIFGISEHWEKNCSWMYWQVNNPLNDHEWKIREVIPQNLESSADKKEEVKEEPRYTVEEVLEAIQILTPMRCSWSWVPEIKKHLNKVKDPQYLEYLRLKAIYE